MKKKYFLLSLTILAGLSLASCGLIKNYGNRKSSTSSSTSSQVSQKDSSKSDKASDKDVSTTTETKRIGRLITAISIFQVIGSSSPT